MTTGEDLVRLSATASAILEFAPQGPQVGRLTLKNYQAAFRRWLGGHRWEGASPTTRCYGEAAVRWGATERLREVSAALDAALDGGDEVAALRAAAEVEQCLAWLRAFPRGKPGKRARGEGERRCAERPGPLANRESGAGEAAA